MNILYVWVVPVAIACKGGVPEWRRNLTHELNLDDKPKCYNEYGDDDEEVDEEYHHYDATICLVLTYENSNTQI